MKFADKHSNSAPARKATRALKQLTERRKSDKAERNLQSKEPAPEVQIPATAAPVVEASSPSSRIPASAAAPPELARDARPLLHDTVQDDGHQVQSSRHEDDVAQPGPSRAEDFDDFRPHVADDGDDAPQSMDDLELIGTQVHEDMMRRQAESNKENIAVQQDQTNLQSDSPRTQRRQPAGQRVSFGDGFVNDAGSDISEDAGFQTQEPILRSNINRARHRTAASPQKRSAGDAPGSQGLSPKKARRQQSNTSSLSHRPAERQNEEPSPSPVLEEVRNANSRAKQMRAFAPKLPQVRKPWEADEIERLVGLIVEHGTSWSLLKEVDEDKSDILHKRDQVALKDKARNIKLDFLL